MAERQEPRVRLPSPFHLGIVVQDLEQAMGYYESLFGWGPFKVQEIDMKKFPFTLHGKAGTGRFKVAAGQCGSMLVELFQVLEGETPYTDFSREKGEGIHHIGFQIEDVDGALAVLAKEGIEPIFHGQLPQGAFAYLDTDKVGGIVFELINFPPFD